MSKKLDVDIFHKTHIKKDAESIFDLISTSAGWDSWFTHGTVFDINDENSYFLWKNWGADKVNVKARIRILEIREPELIKFQWNFELKNGPTEISIMLRKVDEGTILSVTETGFDESKEGLTAFAECSTGWGEALTLIKIFAEHGISYN